MNFGILETIISVLFTALVITVIFRRVNLPVVLGYLLVGILMGPHAFNLIPDIENIKDLAEFGIVFLMFTTGLEFSLPKLFTLTKPAFFIGGLQVLFSIIIIIMIGKLFGITTLPALVIGGIVAMSSTAIVVKQLNDQLDLHSPLGLNAIGILLLQDLAVIPFIILIVSVAENTQHSFPVIILWAAVKGMLAILLLYAVGKWLLKPLFHLISQTRVIELFTLTVLLITLTASWLTNMLGLSYALGAFLAGLMLAETKFRHQIEIEIRPFRDILLGLFFITMGMLADISSWYNEWKWIGLLLTALIFGKLFLITALSLFARNNLAIALRTGLVLAQGGEFGFAILALAITHSMLPPGYHQTILAALLLSIAVAPVLIRFNKPIADFFLQKSADIYNDPIKKEISKIANELNDHVIICGYGRVGQHVATVLDKISIPHIGLDIDSTLVKKVTSNGGKALFGDASHPEILHAAGIDRAKALMISFDNIRATTKTLTIARISQPNLPILVRCKDQAELTELKKHGATKIIAETFEESISLSQQLLQLLKMPKNKISELMREVRKKDYELLRKIFPISPNENPDIESIFHENVMPILLSEGAYAIHHTLSEFGFAEIGIEVIAIRREKLKSIKPHENLKLCLNDIIIVYGPSASIEEAEHLLLEGK